MPYDKIVHTTLASLSEKPLDAYRPVSDYVLSGITKSQVILQHTVEGLSVIVIAYYVAGLGGYIFKGLQEMGWLRNANIASALFVPIAIGLAFGITTFSKKYLHRKLSGEHPSNDTAEP